MENVFELLKDKSLTLQKKVTPRDTYGGLLSTASLSRFLLDTAWQLVEDECHEGVTSVAIMFQLTHEEPTVAGETVTVEAKVQKVEESRVLIGLKALDETGVIAHALNERHIVDVSNLRALAEKRAAPLKTIL